MVCLARKKFPRLTVFRCSGGNFECVPSQKETCFGLPFLDARAETAKPTNVILMESTYTWLLSRQFSRFARLSAHGHLQEFSLLVKPCRALDTRLCRVGNLSKFNPHESNVGSLNRCSSSPCGGLNRFNHDVGIVRAVSGVCLASPSVASAGTFCSPKPSETLRSWFFSLRPLGVACVRIFALPRAH